MGNGRDDLLGQYRMEVRRSWDSIALLLRRPDADIVQRLSERDRLAWSVTRLREITGGRGAGALVERGAGAGAVYCDTTTPMVEIRDLGPENAGEMASLRGWAAEHGDAATLSSMDAVPVWRELLPARGPAVAVARQAVDFAPLVSVICYDLPEQAVTNLAVRAVDHEAAELADSLKGIRLEEQAVAAQHHVLNALTCLRSILEQVPSSSDAGDAGDRGTEQADLQSVVEGLSDVTGALNLAMDWIGDVIRPASTNTFLPMPVSELVSGAVDKCASKLAEQQVAVEVLQGSTSSVYVRESLLSEALGSALEVPRLHAASSRVRIRTRDVGDSWVEICVSWDGETISPERRRAVNSLLMGPPSDWGDVQLLLAARARIEFLCGRVRLESGPRLGNTLYIDLPMWKD